MLEKYIDQEKFEHIIDLLILYKQLNKDKTVYLNEKSIKEAINFMQNAGKQFAGKLGMDV